jgi:hypothetical protein
MPNFKPYYPKRHIKGYASGEPAPLSLPAAGAHPASDKTVRKERFPHIFDTI